MIEPKEFEESEPLEPWGEDYEDVYFDGEDLEDNFMSHLSLLEELIDDDIEWEDI